VSGQPGGDRTPDGGRVLAVDGGNTKTDLALVDATGGLLSLVRGGGSSAHQLGVERSIEVLSGLVEQAAAHAGLDPSERPIASNAYLLLAGADLPEERSTLWSHAEKLGLASELVVDNDTLALLRAGSDRGWGVAVVCGAGINCLGRSPDGREARFLSLGEISGDWGGGGDVGLAALGAAARSADGRGPRTVLESAVPRHFGLGDALEVSRAVHQERIPVARLVELAPVVLAVHEQDAVAQSIVSRMADEVIAFATAALHRLELTAADPDVVLGGGLLRAVSAPVIEKIDRGIHELAPRARVVVSPSQPIVGAALLGLDALGVDERARGRARAELDAAEIRSG
jgi:N-acetylglucosamine kinase-like BadF-type ATPase